MKKALMIIGLTLLLTALPVFSQGSNTSTKKADSNSPKLTDEQKKQDLYSRWNKLNKNKPAEACQIAADYLVNFPEDKSKNAKILKTWLGDYEKTTKCEVPAENAKTGSGSNVVAKTATDKTVDLTGSWTFVVTTTQGDLQFAVTFKQDGKDLSGSVKSPYGDGTVTGIIDGNLITLDAQSGPLDAKLKGTVEDNKMKGTLKANAPNIPELQFVGTRSK